MEHLIQQPSEVCDLMPCQLGWSPLECNGWQFWITKQDDELEYQRKISPIMSSASVVSSCPILKMWIKLHIGEMSSPDISLVQFWAPIEVDGSTFLSTADQSFVLNKKIDNGLSSYRKLCLDTLIPIDTYNEHLLGPPGRVFRRWLPECNPDIQSYSSADFPMREKAIGFGIHSYYAIPVLHLHDQHCRGVIEIVSTEPSLRLPEIVMLQDRAGLDQIAMGLDEILKLHSLPFIQIWIPYSQSGSLIVLFTAGASSYDRLSTMYHEFEYVSEVCFIESGKALVGRAFASQGSCFCKDVTLLSFKEYPLMPSARKARLTQSFAICLQSKCANGIVCVVEYFLADDQMVVRDTKTFLNMLLSTMKEQLPGVIVASGQELGQRMLVEVVKVSPSDELDSFEIGQPLPSVQSFQDGGETTEIYSYCQQSNLQNGENNVATALLVPSCSSHKCDSLNCEGTDEVDPSLPHPLEEAVTNRGTVNMDVAHDDHTEILEDTSEMMQLDSHFEQPNLEINYAGNARSNDKVEHSEVNRESNFVSGSTTNNEKIHSQKNNAIQRIEKDHGITRKILEQHYGMTLDDAAKKLHVSRATLKRIRKEYGISRWPHHKTRKVNYHVSQGISFQGAEPYVGDQQCPAPSQEKGKDYLGHRSCRSTGKPCDDNMMSVKVTYRDDIIKFKLTPSSTMVELEGEVEKRLNISLQRFSIKYQDEDDDLVTITGDSDLREGMHEIRLLGRTTMKLVVTPKCYT